MKQTTRKKPIRSKKKQKLLRSTIKHHARMTLVPHRKNKYSPHLVRWQGIALALMFVVSLQFAYNAWQTGSVLGHKSNVTSNQLLAYTNAEREQQGLGDLTVDPQLSKAAQMKAHDMFANQYWAHTSPDGTQPWQWVKEAGYQYSVAGENLAKGFITSHGVVTAWMNSPEHRKNILDARYDNVGFAVVPGTLQGDNTMLVVALYGSPQTSGALASATPDVLAAQGTQSVASHLGVALQSLNPSILATIVLCSVITVVSLLAHAYRRKLPKEWRTSWRRHHGLYKAVGTGCFMMVVVTLYSGGQI